MANEKSRSALPVEMVDCSTVCLHGAQRAVTLRQIGCSMNISDGDDVHSFHTVFDMVDSQNASLRGDYFYFSIFSKKCCFHAQKIHFLNQFSRRVFFINIFTFFKSWIFKFLSAMQFGEGFTEGGLNSNRLVL